MGSRFFARGLIFCNGKNLKIFRKAIVRPPLFCYTGGTNANVHQTEPNQSKREDSV